MGVKEHIYSRIPLLSGGSSFTLYKKVQHPVGGWRPIGVLFFQGIWGGGKVCMRLGKIDLNLFMLSKKRYKINVLYKQYHGKY